MQAVNPLTTICLFLLQLVEQNFVEDKVREKEKKKEGDKKTGRKKKDLL